MKGNTKKVEAYALMRGRKFAICNCHDRKRPMLMIFNRKIPAQIEAFVLNGFKVVPIVITIPDSKSKKILG